MAREGLGTLPGVPWRSDASNHSTARFAPNRNAMIPASLDATPFDILRPGRASFEVAMVMHRTASLAVCGSRAASYCCCLPRRTNAAMSRSRPANGTGVVRRPSEHEQPELEGDVVVLLPPAPPPEAPPPALPPAGHMGRVWELVDVVAVIGHPEMRCGEEEQAREIPARLTAWWRSMLMFMCSAEFVDETSSWPCTVDFDFHDDCRPGS